MTNSPASWPGGALCVRSSSAYTTAETREALQALHDDLVVAGTQAWLPSGCATALKARGQISGDRVRFQQHAARVALTSRALPPPVGVLSCGVTEVLLTVVGVRDGKAFVADSGRPHCRGHRAAMTFSVARDEWHYSRLVPATAVVANSMMVWRRHTG